MLNLHVNPDPLTLRGRVHGQVPLLAGDTASSVAWRYLDASWLLPQPRVMAVLNGRRLPWDELRVPLMPGDHLSLVQLPHAPVLAVVTSTAFLASLAASAAVSIITGIASYLIMSHQARQVRGEEDSSTYGWHGIDNTTGVGGPLGVLYGEMRTGLQVIQSFRMANRYGGPQLSTLAGDKLCMLYAISEGPIKAIGGLDNDDYPAQSGFNDITAYDAVSNPNGIQTVQLNRNNLTANLLPQARFSGRFGFASQDPIAGFHNTRIEYSVDEGFEAEAAAAQCSLTATATLGLPAGFVYVHVDSTVGFYPNDRAVVDPGGTQNEEVTILQATPPNQRANVIFSTTSSGLGSPSASISVASTSGFLVGETLELVGSALVFFIGAIVGTTIIATSNAPNAPNAQFPAHAAGTVVRQRSTLRLTTNLNFAHAAGHRIQRQGDSIKKDVFYRTTAVSRKITTNTTDRGIVIRLQHDALFSQQGSGIGSKTVIFEVYDRLLGGTSWNAGNRDIATDGNVFRITDRRRGTFFTELAYTPASIQRHSDSVLEILVFRRTALDGPTESSRTFVDSVVEVTDANSGYTDQPDRFAYPGVATLSMTLVATEQFSGGPPTVTFVAKGRGCRSISGGTISTTEAYTSNPAWVVLDMLTNTRYGLGDVFTDANIDTESFEAWAAYCDQLVDDGDGGTHARYTFDGKFDRSEPRFDAAARAAATAWCTLVMTGNVIKAKYEHVDDPGGGQARPRVQLFTMANIIRDSFVLEWLNTEARPTVYNVQILNRDRDYEQDSIAVLDIESVGANDPTVLEPMPSRPETYRLEGVVRPAQARRDASRRHRINRLVKRKVSFDAPIEAVGLEVGDRFAVAYGAMKWFGPGPIQSTLFAATLVGATSCVVLDPHGWNIGDTVQFEPNTVRVETAELTDVDHDTNTLTFAALTNAHNINGAVVNLGSGVTTTCAVSNSASGQTLLNVTTSAGLNPSDELWIEPGTAFEERGYVDSVTSATQVRMRQNLTQTHTTVRAGTVVNLTAPSFTARTNRAGAATTDLYLDIAVTIPTTIQPVVFVIRLQDGTIDQRTITAAAGTYAKDAAISFSGGAIDYHRGAPVAIGVDGQTVRDFICQSTELDGDGLVRHVEGLEYVEAVYEDTTLGPLSSQVEGQEPEVATTPATIPEASVISEVTCKQAEAAGAKGIDVYWTRELSDQAAPSKVWWRRVTDDDSDLWRAAGETTGAFWNIAEADEEGVTYEVVVTPRSVHGAYPDPGGQTAVTVTVYAEGARFPAAVPAGLLVSSDLGA